MRRGVVVLCLLFTALGAACAGRPRPAAVPKALTLNARQLDSLWVRAQGLVAAKKWVQAGPALERFLLELPFGDPRALTARMQLGETYLGDKSNLLAIREFRRIADENPTDSLAPYALLRAGDAYTGLWRRPELDASDGLSAMSVYQELLTRYPRSPAVKLANQAIGKLEDKFAKKALGAADYYLRYKAYDSAIIYLKEILVDYPRSSVAPDVWSRLIGAYRVLGYKEDVLEACAFLRANWPNTAKLNVTCPQPLAAGSATVR